ncbi:UDP-N-acetyl-alpha-D-muramoyl-L-alanyl-L-glutamate epimerase [Metallibacterium scheffleri]|uniref:UDP-N-acetyl-alpha-D-muramoyl-L-alanyl-L-glutamate epimerase n=2 Tax=root TaxID=1 RepID=A0A4S3KL95_9GAMM|nr:UDP-N-acetyl-alpha-D-muramoyl-L-alanyl-L-glutamate epimerase [Metallibacterium scheffleri]THD09635.1 hypothetical protein B1806_10680 [Metallibacterium scheffleri]
MPSPVTELPDPRQARVFRFTGCDYAAGEARLRYAFDEGPALVERIRFPDAPALAGARADSFQRALRLLHLLAGVSYYKAGVAPELRIDGAGVDAATLDLLRAVYTHGLAEFAYRNGLDLRGRMHWRVQSAAASAAPALGLPPRTLVPIGGGKDSLVAIEALRSIGAECTAAWVGNSPLIAACAAHTGLPTLNIERTLAPELFAYNRMGAWNGHVPVTAVNSAILVCAAILYGHDSIAFANERSASSATLEYDGQPVNHQWSKGWDFEQAFAHAVRQGVAADLHYCSLLRPWSELAVTRAFARLPQYFGVFSSCNRNFRILGPKPSDRWCGQCPKCHFVFLALAPFLPKPRLLAIFGRNLLDDETQAAGFDALLEYRGHKPFECVGEGAEARAAMAALAQRPEWREDVLVARFRSEILAQLDPAALALEPWLTPQGAHGVPARLAPALAFLRA